MINSTVRPIHFEDFGGPDFERLVFAYHVRAGWTDLAWYGQTGSDLGRDIIGVEPLDGRPNLRTVIQCVNRRALTLAKAHRDMTSAISSPTGMPDAFRFVCRGNVSAKRRDEIGVAAKSLGIANLSIWSGAEFEEQLRLRAEFLLHRLVEGVPFPESAVEIRRFADDFSNVSDDDALALMAAVFDRPAFRTRFQEECSLPSFEQALADTIAALNTGVWRTREGDEIRRIPSLHHLKSPAIRSGLGAVVRGLDEVRRVFKRGLESGSIRHCGCNQPSCPVFFVSPAAARELDDARRQVLATFRTLHASFDVHLD